MAVEEGKADLHAQQALSDTTAEQTCDLTKMASSLSPTSNAWLYQGLHVFVLGVVRALTASLWVM